MKIYDEITKEELKSPDLTVGCLYNGAIVTGRVEERIEVIDGTVTEDRPEGLRHLVPAQDIVEPCQWYHAYTKEELSANNQGASSDSDLASRISSLEEELKAAKILLGVE